MSRTTNIENDRYGQFVAVYPIERDQPAARRLQRVGKLLAKPHRGRGLCSARLTGLVGDQANARALLSKEGPT